MAKVVTVIGAGLAGCEAAFQLSKRGVPVRLVECKRTEKSPAHQSDGFAELVCSNSLKSNDPATAGGLLKQELRLSGSLLLECADRVAVPAGGALAVDRTLFSESVTRRIRALEGVRIIEEKAEDFSPDALTVIATGPLTLDPLAHSLEARLGRNLHFFDAAAPVVSAESIDFDRTFSASRYGKGGADDYVNCPLTKEEYEVFWSALVGAQSARLHDFEKSEIFEGCMPVEIMAKRGHDTVRFGPMKPVGMSDPRTGRRPYALLQLRAENAQRSMFNLVGFQTNLTFSEQRRVFGLIPALKNAEFLRYGVMHRNSFVNAPAVLGAGFGCRLSPDTFIAGQLSGVEGYVESIGSGLWAGINAARRAEGLNSIVPPETTVMGALMRYLATPNPNFQPMNANFGILPPLTPPLRDKRMRKEALKERSMAALTEFLKSVAD